MLAFKLLNIPRTMQDTDNIIVYNLDTTYFELMDPIVHLFPLLCNFAILVTKAPEYINVSPPLKSGHRFTYDSLIDVFLVSESLVADVFYISTFLFNSKYSLCLT